MQDSLNSKINSNWKSLDEYQNYMRAIWTELAEGMESSNFKWWKHTPIDMDNLFVETIDVFHFILSAMIKDDYNNPISKIYTYDKTGGIEIVFNYYEGFNKRIVDEESLRVTIDETAFIALGFSLGQFPSKDGLLTPILTNLMEIWNYLGKTKEDIFKYYLVKNLLNIFRQDNGYKTGEYIKDWNGKEDNAVCLEIAADIPADDNFIQAFNDIMYNKYEEIKSNATA